MKDLNLNLIDILRYLIIGTVISFFIYLYYPEFVKTYFDTIGPLSSLLFILSAGILFYHLYHPILYRHAFIRLKHLFIKRSINIRRYIKDKYNFDSQWIAEQFYYLVRENCFTENAKTVTHFHGAGIHLLYMCSVIFLGSAFFEINGRWTIVLVAACLVSYFAALMSDQALERHELALFKQAENKESFEKLLSSFQEISAKNTGIT